MNIKFSKFRMENQMKCDDCAKEKEMTAEESQAMETEAAVDPAEACDAETGVNVSSENEPEAEEEPCIVYDEVIRNEKGLIKRDGFKMNGVNYGPEFEQENLNKAFKTAIAGVLIMVPLFFLVILFFWKYFKPFIGN